LGQKPKGEEGNDIDSWCMIERHEIDMAACLGDSG